MRRQGPPALSAGGPGRPSDPRAPVTGTVRGRWPGGSSFEGGTETRSSTRSPEPHSCAPLGDRHPGLRGHRRVASSRPLLLLETSSYGLVPGNVVTGEHACTREAPATPCLSWAVCAEWPPGSSGSPVPRAQPPGPATGLCPPPPPPASMSYFLHRFQMQENRATERASHNHPRDAQAVSSSVWLSHPDPGAATTVESVAVLPAPHPQRLAYKRK